MNKNKFITLLLMAVLFLNVISCKKDEINNSVNNTETKVINKKKFTSYTPKQFEILNSIAQELAKTVAERPNTLNALHTLIDTILVNGLDEEIRFLEFFNVSESRLFKPCEEIEMLNSSFSKIKDLLSKVDLNNENNYGDCQIYWIYSDIWKEGDIPTVAYVTGKEDDKTTSINGYKFVNGSLVNVEVTEEYAKNNPTLIINYNESSYSNLPYFVNGSHTNNNGVIYMSAPPGYEPPAPYKPEPWTDINTIYDVRLPYFKATEQYDNWICGGSEFMFKIKYIKSFSIWPSAITDGTTVACYRTRKQINNGTPLISPYTILNANWIKESNNSRIKIYEDDGGSLIQADASVELNVLGYNIVQVPATFSLNSWDDEVYEFSLPRTSFISHYIQGGTGYATYAGGHVEFRMSMSTYSMPY